MGTYYCILNHKNTSICHFEALYSLWHVVHNFCFAKSREKPHNKSNFKHFGLTVPNIRKLNPTRIRLRMTQRIILHGEPAFLKQSPLGWTGVGRVLENVSSLPFFNQRCEQCSLSTFVGLNTSEGRRSTRTGT